MAARVTPGAISLSSSSHFALMPYSNWINPVALPPGRAKLSTKPAPTGSGTITNTIGIVRVVCSNGAAAALPVARITSGDSATSSAAYLRKSSGSPAGQRHFRHEPGVGRLRGRGDRIVRRRHPQDHHQSRQGLRHRRVRQRRQRVVPLARDRQEQHARQGTPGRGDRRRRRNVRADLDVRRDRR